MKRYITIFSWIVLFLMFYPANGQCISIDLRGHVASLYILRDNVLFNLSYFSNDYTTLGDPFIINIQSDILSSGTNNFSIRTGDSIENFTGCSQNNTFIYNAMLRASVSYSDVLEKEKISDETLFDDDIPDMPDDGAAIEIEPR